jgi:hypothetical protein
VDTCAPSPGLARKLIIPAGLNWELRDKQDQMDMTERVLIAWSRRTQRVAEAVV